AEPRIRALDDGAALQGVGPGVRAAWGVGRRAVVAQVDAEEAVREDAVFLDGVAGGGRVLRRIADHDAAGVEGDGVGVGARRAIRPGVGAADGVVARAQDHVDARASVAQRGAADAGADAVGLDAVAGGTVPEEHADGVAGDDVAVRRLADGVRAG